MARNLLYYGNNLDFLRDPKCFPDESIDLVYLDPPFNSNATYNVLFKEQDGSKAAAQIRAFEDTWKWDDGASEALHQGLAYGGRLAQCLAAFQTLLSTSNMMAYLAMMAPRLAELRRVLKPTGSIYLHCDPTASHYLKLLMDAIFGADKFRNEIVWKRTTAHSSAKRYAPVHDTLLYYARGTTPTWNEPREPYAQEYLDHYYRYDDGDGRLYWRADLCAAGTRNGPSGQQWRGFDVATKGMHWKFQTKRLDELDAEGRIYWPKGGQGWPQYKRYRDELKGKALPDFWSDIDRINPVGNERLGYPTQKPEALLERIIQASSNEGDTVLDPFCGCGTAIVAAEKLHRQWIGIDITHIAITLIKNRLKDTFDEASVPYVEGAPTDLPDAEALAELDRYQFQWWALGLVDASAVEQKKGADKGIDGRLYFEDGPRSQLQSVVISVKSGNVNAGQVRDLIGTVGNENAAMGVFITLKEPTQPMRAAAATAGFYESRGHGSRHPRIQILTIEELLDGRAIDYPSPPGGNRTFRRARKHVTSPKGEPLRFPI